MPCILCHRYIAALPLPVCQRCKDARRIRELLLRAAEGLPPTEEEKTALPKTVERECLLCREHRTLYPRYIPPGVLYLCADCMTDVYGK